MTSEALMTLLLWAKDKDIKTLRKFTDIYKILNKVNSSEELKVIYSRKGIELILSKI